MNPKFAEKFISINRDKILRLFSFYQIIEIMLFWQLYSKDFTKLDEESQKRILLKKTLGKLTKKYKQTDSCDDLILAELNELITERNQFMHSMWVILAISKSEDEAFVHGNYMLDKYQKRAKVVFELLGTPSK